jgi:hypothetical protein
MQKDLHTSVPPLHSMLLRTGGGGWRVFSCTGTGRNTVHQRYATSGASTRDTGNPRTGKKTYAAGNSKRAIRIIPPGIRAIHRCVQQENPGTRTGWGSRGPALDTIKKLRLRYRDSRYPFKVPVIGCNTINLPLPHYSDVESIVQ